MGEKATSIFRPSMENSVAPVSPVATRSTAFPLPPLSWASVLPLSTSPWSGWPVTMPSRLAMKAMPLRPMLMLLITSLRVSYL